MGAGCIAILVFFSSHMPCGLSSFPIALARNGVNPSRIALISAVALLWILCFAALFSRDRRKAKLRYIQKRQKCMEFVEKRRHVRVSYPMSVRYRVIAPKEIAGSILVSNARNLSPGGILLETKEDLPIGTRLELKLTLCGTTNSILVEGIVQRKEWHGSLSVFSTGIMLDVKSAKDRAKLDEFIEMEHRREEIT